MSETKIDLEYPYSQDWKNGYLVTNPEGRKTLILYNSHTDRSSTQYARYLLAVKEGRYLTSDEEADHIDNDKTNDRIGNLRITTSEANRQKELNRRAMLQTTYTVTCDICNNDFMITQRQVNAKISSNVSGMYCSKMCAWKAPKTGSVGKPISPELISSIRELRSEGASAYSISTQLGVARNTVMKYW